MRRMLGDSVLPNRLSEKRRDVRRRIKDLREPVQQRREDYVPGPDIVGEAEDKLFSTKDSLLGRVQSSDLLGGFNESTPGGSGGPGDTVSARNTSTPSQTVEGKEPRSTSSTGSSDTSDDDEDNNVRTVGI